MARTQRPTSFPVRTESWPFATANGTESRIPRLDHSFLHSVSGCGDGQMFSVVVSVFRQLQLGDCLAMDLVRAVGQS